MSTTPQQETDTTRRETVGNRLKRERLSKHLTLEEATAATRVNSKMLRAIEEDDKTNLPARVYVQGFIRLYAQYLGLDPQALLEQYAIQTDQTIDSRSKINVRKVLESETMAENPTIMSSKQLLVMLLIALLAILLYLGRDYRPRQNAPTVQPTVSQPEIEVPPLPQAEEPVPAEPATTGEESLPAPEEPVAAPQPPQPPKVNSSPVPEAAPPLAPTTEPVPKFDKPTAEREPYQLRARFTERTWMWIKVDDAKPREYTFEAGQRYRWTAYDQIDINLGNAGGVELTLNGKKIPKIGISGQVVRLTVPEATQTLLTGSDVR